MASAWDEVDKGKLLERFAIEIGPALLFVAALLIVNLNVATILFVVACAATATYSWYQTGHFPYIPAGMVLMAAVFGAATIAFGNAFYIEFRATLVNAGGAAALTAGLFTGHLFLKNALQSGFRLTDSAWRTLTWRMALYLALMAILNEIVRRAFSTEIWAVFKAVSPVLNLVFLAINWPLIRANLLPRGAASDTARGNHRARPHRDTPQPAPRPQ
ncbi:septation protein IspZ [Acuticoccus sp. M5D2P5]|uniref:inner membrane-spanning protein YciB n=1 Tax=Acuticoccus kalidii TaxID=2910977 RepID=UPI001F23DBB9|nr:septation protein IspZ [Acuticoccus kalidii]MCF3934296.1 septation protein IspZ [Acuticoccus kalidii]